MTDATVQLLGRYLISVLALIAGVLFVYWGVKLYASGTRQRNVGDVSAEVGKSKFSLSKGAPGSFLAAAGVAVIIVTLVTMPRFKTSVTGRPVLMDSIAFPYTETIEIGGIPAEVGRLGDSLGRLDESEAAVELPRNEDEEHF
jgi:hypothetical protein